MKEFEVMQMRTAKFLLVWLGGFMAVMVVAIKGMDTLLAEASPIAKTVWFLATIGGGIYGLFRLAWAVSKKPTLVVIDENGLTMLDHLTGDSQQALFSDVAAYRYSDFNNVEQLRVKLKSGANLKIAINTKLKSGQSLSRMVRAFESALGVYRTQLGELNVTLREKTFFEKQISTVVMVLLTAGVTWLIWDVCTTNKSVQWGSVCLVSSNFLIYLGAWLANRSKRVQL